MVCEFDRNYRCFRQQDVEVSIFELLDCLTDDEQVDYCNIVRNMSLHHTRRTNFVLSEIQIWAKYLQFALQKMYDVSNESDRSLKAEINRLSRQLAIRDSSNTPMSAMTRSLPAVGSTNRRGRDNDDSSDRLESSHTTPQRGRLDQRST